MTAMDKEVSWAGYFVVLVLLFVLWIAVIPVVPTYRRSDQSKKALKEVAAFDEALVRAMNDAEVRSFRDFFGTVAFGDEARAMANVDGISLFEASARLYTSAAYAIVRDGTNAIAVLESEASSHSRAGRALLASRLQKLDEGYLDLGEDPWGNLYNVYPGPWRDGDGPIPFRVYRNAGGHLKPDGLTVAVAAPEQSAYSGSAEPTKENVSYPAPRERQFFIWSNGENLVSDQSLPPSEIGYGKPLQSYYAPNRDEEYRGGGDDVNNWDAEKSWMLFYR